MNKSRHHLGRTLAAGLLALHFAVGQAWAGVTQTIDYQGFLGSQATGLPINAPTDINFAIFTQATGGASVWNEQRCTTNRVAVIKGRYEVQIGSVTGGGIPAGVFQANPALWLEVQIDPTFTNCSFTEQLAPRIRLQASPYAFEALHASTATSLANGAIGSLPYQSGANATAMLGISGANTILRSNGAVPVWTTAGYPNAVAQGDLLYGSVANTVSQLPVGTANKLLQSNGTVPGWTAAGYPNAVAQGDLLYGSAANTVASLAKNVAATRYLANTGAANSPAWDQVDLTNGVMNILPTSSGGTGANLSGVPAAQGSIPFFSATNVMTTLGPTAGGALSGWVLRTNGAGADPAWADLSSIGTVNTANNLAGGAQGSVPYQSGAGATSMLAAGTANKLLRTAGAGSNPTWTTATYPNGTTINQILYSNAANSVTGLASVANRVIVTNAAGAPTMSADLPAGFTIGLSTIFHSGGTPIPYAEGGTNADLSVLGNGSLVYKTAGNLAGAVLTGVIKGNGAGAPTAMTGTVGENAYWSDANTIGSQASIGMTSGGTGADLSGVATGGLIYKSGAATLGGTAALSGVLKGNGAGVPTAINGTQNQITYWTDANTIGSTAAISVGLGGTGANLVAAATGGLIYKSGATTFGGTAALTGVLKGNGAGVPTAINGTQNQISYWTDANTIGSTAAISVGLGGTGADLSAVATGGLIYKSGVTTLAGTGQLTGVLKGNGAGAPSVATQDDLSDGTTYKQYNPAAVAITGGSVGGTTVVRFYNRSIAQLVAITPTAKGEMYFCTNCSPAKNVVSTGTVAGNFASTTGGTFQ